MLIKEISLSKSKTVGFITDNNRTRFKKITITSIAELTERDNPDESYKILSNFIEKQFEYEKK